MSRRQADVPDGGFPRDVYGFVRWERGSQECRELEQHYPGLRFNRVEVCVFPGFRFENSPDEDYLKVFFNISGAEQAFKAHGFDRGWYSPLARVKTQTGFRLSNARYEDGLDRISVVFIPSLLERFGSKEEQS